MITGCRTGPFAWDAQVAIITAVSPVVHVRSHPLQLTPGIRAPDSDLQDCFVSRVLLFPHCLAKQSELQKPHAFEFAFHCRNLPGQHRGTLETFKPAGKQTLPWTNFVVLTKNFNMTRYMENLSAASIRMRDTCCIVNKRPTDPRHHEMWHSLDRFFFTLNRPQRVSWRRFGKSFFT